MEKTLFLVALVAYAFGGSPIASAQESVGQGGEVSEKGKPTGCQVAGQCLPGQKGRVGPNCSWICEPISGGTVPTKKPIQPKCWVPIQEGSVCPPKPSCPNGQMVCDQPSPPASPSSCSVHALAAANACRPDRSQHCAGKMERERLECVSDVLKKGIALSPACQNELQKICKASRPRRMATIDLPGVLPFAECRADALRLCREVLSQVEAIRRARERGDPAIMMEPSVQACLLSRESSIRSAKCLEKLRGVSGEPVPVYMNETQNVPGP